jgi:hypothetical protein
MLLVQGSDFEMQASEYFPQSPPTAESSQSRGRDADSPGILKSCSPSDSILPPFLAFLPLQMSQCQ